MMDLRSLKDTLTLEKDVAHLGGTGAPTKLSDTGRLSVVDEILSQYVGRHDKESEQIGIILMSTVDVIKAEGLEPSATALFAALMSALSRSSETADIVEDDITIAAMCHLLSAVLARVPTSVLRSRCVYSVKILTTILDASDNKSQVYKNALPCLSQCLAAMGPNDWPGSSRGFALVLASCLDHHPKTRKRAHSAMVDILASLQNNASALSSASDAVMRLCDRVLLGPEQSARKAARVPNKQRQQAEEAITSAVADALHLLGLLRQIIFLLSGPEIQRICDVIMSLYSLRQPLLTRHATDTLAALAASSASHVSPALLANLVSAILASEYVDWNKMNAESSLATIKFLEDAILRIAAEDTSLASSVLPRCTYTLVQLLVAPQDGVRHAASMSLSNLFSTCITDNFVSESISVMGKDLRNKPSKLQRIISAVESALGPQYCDAWELSLPVASELIERLGREKISLADGILLRLGELCAGGNELADELAEYGGTSEDEERVMLAAQNALGRALVTIGPEPILSILPLRIEEGLAGSDESRTWMIPLLKIHVRESHIEYWLDELMPLAKKMGLRAAGALPDPSRQREAQTCTALESQIWSTLPSFCSWATDVGDNWSQLSKSIAPAFEKRQDLRIPICHAIRRVSLQTNIALKSNGEHFGYADPSNCFEGDDSHPSGLKLQDMDQEDAHSEVPESFSVQTAHKSLEALRSTSRIWLTLLLNAFVSTPANRRGHIQDAISSYACLCEPSTIAPLFRSAITKFLKVSEQARTGELGRDAVFEGGDSDSERCSTFLEGALSLAGGLDISGMEVLYKAAVPGIKQRDPARQKKSYKVLAYILESRPDFYNNHFQDLLIVLLEGSSNSLSASKRYRLRCLKAAILSLLEENGPFVDLESLPDSARNHLCPLDQNSVQKMNQRLQVAYSIVTPLTTEIILCLKESNKRTRANAYDLFVDIAKALHEKDPPKISETNLEITGGGLRSLVNMVLAGLVGSTAHMISASIMALARLLFEFSPILSGLVPDLLPAVLMFLRSKAREVIKSVLGFIKVVAMRMPVSELQRFLPSICEGILVWAEDSKNKFRMQVRIILERLAKRCGFDALEAAIPASHHPLFTHIRKENSRRERKRSVLSSEMDGFDEDAKTLRTSAGYTTKTRRTAIGSAWNSDVFEIGEDDMGAKSTKTHGRRTIDGRSMAISVGGRKFKAVSGARSARSIPSNGRGFGLPFEKEPLDLLDMRASREMMKRPPRRSQENTDGIDIEFEHGEDGRMIIREEGGNTDSGKRKRSGDAYEAGFDSEDSDFEDLKGFTGLSLALKGTKSVAAASSYARSIGGKSMGKASFSGRRTATNPGKSQHSGERFRAKKSGAKGDVKGKSKIEPYAYWPLDRNLMNRRASKARGAKQGLDKVVAAALGGAAKGRKAKRMKLK